MTAFKMIYMFFKSEKGYTVKEIADRLDVSVDTVKRWMREGYTTRSVLPRDIIANIFADEPALMRAFIDYLKLNVCFILDSVEIRDEYSTDDFERFLALFLADDTNGKHTYNKILQTVSEPASQIMDADSVIREKTVELEKARIFASCGKESSVFAMQSREDGLYFDVNFEKTRLREVIPDYAGVYFLLHPVLDICADGKIRFMAKSEDESLAKIWVELKPKGRAWMHESFCFSLSSRWQEFCIDGKAFAYPETLGCLEEITFVIKTDSFADQELLKGKMAIADLRITK
jgi:transcriptional regulator with XRE-family HTH domain